MSAAEPNTRPKRYALWAVAAVVVVVVIVFAWILCAPRPMDFAGGERVALGNYQGQDPTGVPPELKSASLLERGEYLTRAADCAACHTAEDGAPFAGGRAFVLPFGTLYSTNITPDQQSGIGNYSDADFLNAVHKGIGRGGTRLYPAMPYASYTYMTDADALAIKAYLFSLKPVHAAAPQNTFGFPFNQRGLMTIWSVLFNPDKRFQPHVGRSPEWNRGAYLVEALGHCGECHTPRNLFQALNNRSKFAGNVLAGWRAYNITPDRISGLGAWSDADIGHYLSLGHADGHGTAAGPMGEAVDEGLSHLTQADIAAMVAYLRSVPAVATSDLPQPNIHPAPSSPAEGVAASVDLPGKAMFEGDCASCHGWSGVSPVIPFATLTGARAVNDPTAINVVQVVLSGAHRHATGGGANMPAFSAAYSDYEIASVANYVTGRFGAQPSALTAERVAKLRTAD
jgi:mono/diheme cytochrome c family protein